ncbi:MAG: hypothetical protein M3O15_01615 [Acidobacteriota bacterium]|nr:hypothetical protein [Acidobacteriota bacterium]
MTAVTSDGDTLLVGSGDQGGGLFSGTPGSISWAERANSLGTGVEELAVVPGSPESWVVGLGDYANSYSEVFVSTNQGTSWTKPNGLPPAPPCGFHITRLLREPGASRTVYLLVTTVPYCVPTPTYTLLRSDDGGLSFTSLVSGSFVAAPDIWMSRVAPGPLYLLTDNGFHSSSNKGASFSLLSTLPQAAWAWDSLRLAGSEAGAPSFYVLASSTVAANTSALFASADGGLTWVDRGDIYTLTSDPYRANGLITASISTPSLVMLGGIDAYRSTDSGATFHPVNNWWEYGNDPAHLLHADVRGLDFFFYRGTETFFADTDGGTYMSTDLGATFNNIQQFGIINGEYYSTLTSKNDPNLIAAGSQDQGFQQSVPVPLAAMSFDAFPGGDNGHLTSTAGDHNMLYAAGAGSSGAVAVLDHESPPKTSRSPPPILPGIARGCPSSSPIPPMRTPST